ncbi:hypothetical protein [Spiroplasma endosymbiont of Panorpa germanica]|uniref:hypothetical protein n=1 Tax=Spiroplasma endosymbiont of Panorpa germanica TaxID=3066314 RepID=UPI0030CCA1E4
MKKIILTMLSGLVAATTSSMVVSCGKSRVDLNSVIQERNLGFIPIPKRELVLDRIKELNPDINYLRIGLKIGSNIATISQLAGGIAYKIGSTAKLYYNSKLSYGGADEPNFKCNFNEFQRKGSFIINILDKTYDPKIDQKIYYGLDTHVDITHVIDKNNDFIIVTLENKTTEIDDEYLEENLTIYWHDAFLVDIDITFI